MTTEDNNRQSLQIDVTEGGTDMNMPKAAALKAMAKMPADHLRSVWGTAGGPPLMKLLLRY